MKFYDRDPELKLFEETRKMAEQSSRMTVIIGRRRIGKTTLIKEAFKDQKMLYFFITRKSEALLCEEFVDELVMKTNRSVPGEFKSFSKLFEQLLQISETEHFTLVLDEFQEFNNINKSVFSEMQNLWDQYKNRTKMNLVMSGSIFTLMKKIFENAKEPLFGRTNERIYLKPFSINTLGEIMQDYNPNGFSADDMLAFYVLTGGVAKYVELFADKQCFTLDLMLDEIFRDNSLLIEEGKNLLIEEFGKEYATYFSILSLIASSRTSRSEIESVLEKNVGGFLDKLEHEYQIISSIRPVLSKPGSRNVKYLISDNFLNFWFRFVHKYLNALEIGNYGYVKNLVQRDYETYSGLFLEKYFREKLALTGNFSQVGRYWSKRNQNEIDLVAVNDYEKTALIAEVKRNRKKINLEKLRLRSTEITEKLPGYQITHIAFSLEDMFG
ncbi:MAG: ATP-binding protein [Bacteroidales bacterium]|nr:ATP-binding protein [Bacteroidales bacterium]